MWEWDEALANAAMEKVQRADGAGELLVEAWDVEGFGEWLGHLVTNPWAC